MTCFTPPVKLVGAGSTGNPDPTSGPFGGEPSIAADPLGHFALETHAVEIGRTMKEFFTRVLPAVR